MAGLVAAYVVAIAVLTVWLVTVTGDALREQLIVLQRPALDLLLFVVVVCGLVAAPEIIRWLRRHTSLRWMHLVIPAALTLVVTLTVPPKTNRIYYDELIYQSVGHNMADIGRAQMCNDGATEAGRLQCGRGEYNKQPYGYPHVLSVLYRAFGVHEAYAHVLNAVATTMLTLVVCLIGAIAWRDARAGAFTGGIIGLLPQQLLWSRTAAAEPSAALAASLAVLSWFVFARMRRTSALLFAVATTAWAMQFRPESILLVPVFAVFVLLGMREELRRRRIWWAALLGLVLCAPLVAHMVAVRNEGWGTTAERMSLAYVADNLRVNGWFYLWDGRFPWLVTALAALGAEHVRRRWREAVLVGSWFAAYFGIYLVFYAGSYNYGADVRYSLLTYPALAVLAGLGASRACDLLHRLVPTRPGLAAVAVACVLAFSWLNYLPLVRAIGEEAWAARADVEYAREFTTRLPRNSLVLTHNPNMFLLWGSNAAQTSIAATEPNYVSAVYFPRYDGGVFFHWNFWCNVNDPIQRQFCTDVLDKFDYEQVESRRVRDQRFVVYRLTGPKTVRPQAPDRSDSY